ncbi:MAG: hypothetical protein RIM68_10850, partial [Arenibacter sp.]
MKLNQAPIFFILLLTILCFNACQEVKEVKSEDPKPLDFVDLVYPLPQAPSISVSGLKFTSPKGLEAEEKKNHLELSESRS